MIGITAQTIFFKQLKHNRLQKSFLFITIANKDSSALCICQSDTRHGQVFESLIPYSDFQKTFIFSCLLLAIHSLQICSVRAKIVQTDKNLCVFHLISFETSFYLHFQFINQVQVTAAMQISFSIL